MPAIARQTMTGTARIGNWMNFEMETEKTAGAMAQAMLNRLAKDEDDATVVVIQETNGP